MDESTAMQERYRALLLAARNLFSLTSLEDLVENGSSGPGITVLDEIPLQDHHLVLEAIDQWIFGVQQSFLLIIMQHRILGDLLGVIESQGRIVVNTS